MVFNSFKFWGFFLAFLVLYYLVCGKNKKAQNVLLLIASYVFYGIAEWKMLPLMIGVSVVFFFLGIGIGNNVEKKPKVSSLLTICALVISIGLLLYFKYFNFFISEFARLFNAIGFQVNFNTFNIIMPLGISFFTFRIMSYIVEVHRENMEPTRDFIEFAAYIAFFPCILSGPIDRPNIFLPQLRKERVFTYENALNGGLQFLWGLFKKVVIADNLSLVVDSVWGYYGSTSGSTLLLTSFLYLFEMYADFSGYSDMAIAVGRLMGIKVAENFKNPLFAVNIADFWRRWHMSLTTIFTDYVYMPLNFTFRSMRKVGMILAIIINFVLVGLWHGANWTFVFYGIYHGLLFVPLIISGAFDKNSKIKTGKLGLPVLKDFGRMVLTFSLVTLGLVIFRADSVGQALDYLSHMFSSSLLTIPNFVGVNNTLAIISMVYIIFMLAMDWIYKKKDFVLHDTKSPVLLAIIVSFLTLSIYYIGASAQTFIYFQF